MKKNLLFVLAFLLIATTSFATSFTSAKVNDLSNERDTRLEEVTYLDDFEGTNEWTTLDETEATQGWHNYTEGGANGEVWWMGDEELGGYVDVLYLVLDTPSIDVTAGNSTLTFDMNYAVEAPGGTGDYNGWDGSNIRISTDGENWTVIEGTPAYNCTSMYSFGTSHNEGVGVPGWGGSTDGWVEASYDLSSYVGQTVQIRFAFASDPAYNTGDDEDLFGIKIDNIALGTFSNDGSADATMTASSLVPLGGDIWNIADIGNAAFSGSKVYSLQNDEGTYNPNLLNSLISPEITLPSEGEITASYQLMGAFADADADANDLSLIEYMGYEISIVGEPIWYAMSNPYGDATGSNYVYSSVSDIWAPVVESYTGLDGRIDDYAGEDVQFKIYFRSDSDTPDGTGIMVDDFTVSRNIYLPNPSNFVAEVNGTEVDLSWDAPLSMAPTDVMPATGNAVSFVSDSAPYAIALVNTDDYDKPLTEVGFQLYNTGGSVTGSVEVCVWADDNGLPAADPMVTIGDVTGMVSQQWMNVNVASENIVVPANGTIYVGINNFDVVDQGLLAEDSSAEVLSYALSQGVWTPLDEAYNTLKNVFIKATILVDDPSVPSADSYKVYHSEDGNAYSELGEVATTSFTHSSPVQGITNFYRVTAIFGVNESEGITTNVFLLPAGLVEMSYDDNQVNQAYNGAVGSQSATKFVHTHEATLTYVKFYAHTLGTNPLIYRVHADENGLPGEQLVNSVVSASDITLGWNTVELSTPIEFTNGKFHIIFLSTNNATLIGLDTDNHNQTTFSTDSGTSWNVVADGNLMVRAIVQNGAVDNNNQEVTPVISGLSNYPNPFNPETTISFNMSNDGKASLAIYNVRGQLVNTLANDTFTAGNHNVVWKGNDAQGNSVATGVYFYQLKTERQTVSKKMVLQK